MSGKNTSKDLSSRKQPKKTVDDDPLKVVLSEGGAKQPKKKAGAKDSVADDNDGQLRGKLALKKGGKDTKKKKKKDPVAKKQPSFAIKKKRKPFLMRLLGGQDDVVLYDPRAIEAADGLRLNQSHLKTLKNSFDTIDVDGSGSIDIDEFLESIGEQRSPFTDKVFKAIDIDASGSIEFDEFVRILATYCMYTKDDILRFCFECFDKDGSNAIDENEFMQLCKVINNASPMFPGNFKRALEQFDINDDGLIDYREFCELERRYPIILFPAFRLQDGLQKMSLGESEWVKIVEQYGRSKAIEEYKATHGGRAPPDPIEVKIGKFFCPCLFKEKVHIKLGADMEARHRAGLGDVNDQKK